MTSRVESSLTALTAAGKLPGMQYAVVTSAGVLFAHNSGWADIRRRVPVDPSTTMMAYSMSKTITAVAVLQLVETGRVGLDDPVEQYLGSLQPYGPDVTIRQLISRVCVRYPSSKSSGAPGPPIFVGTHPGSRIAHHVWPSSRDCEGECGHVELAV